MRVNSKLTVLSLLLLSFTNAISQFAGQGKKLDSLIKNLDRYPNPDTLRLNALIAVLEQSVANAAPYKAEKYYSETMALARKFKQQVRIANCYHFMGRLNISKKNYDTALIWFDSAIGAYQLHTDPRKRDWGIA